MALTQTEKAALRIIRDIQRAGSSDFCIRPLRSDSLQRVQASVPMIVVPDARVELSEPLPPGRDVGSSAAYARIAINPSLPYAIERFRVVWHIAMYCAGIGGFALEGRAAPYLVALAAVMPVEELDRKGDAFIRRKIAALTAVPGLWNGLSLTYLIRCLARLQAHLRQYPVAQRLSEALPASYLCDLGRTARLHCRFAAARKYLRRAVTVGTASGDWRSVTTAYLNLGLVGKAEGRLAVARSYCRRSARIAKQHGLSVLEAKAVHGLASIAIETREVARAMRLARRAFRLYPHGHHDRARLAYDVGFCWLEEGRTERALGVFRTLLAHIIEPGFRALLCAVVSRAAAELREIRMYKQWREIAEVELLRLTDSDEGFVVASGMLQLAIAAQEVEDSAEAGRLLSLTAEISSRTGETGIALEVAERSNVARVRRLVSGLTEDGIGEEFAQEMISDLPLVSGGTTNPATLGGGAGRGS